MSLESYCAVKDFLSVGEKKECIVSISGADEEIPNLSNKVIVIIGEYSNSIYNVNINWEDEPFGVEDYKEYGLFGYYSTRFCKMDYDKMSNTLTIHSSNGTKIMLTY